MLPTSVFGASASQPSGSAFAQPGNPAQNGNRQGRQKQWQKKKPAQGNNYNNTNTQSNRKGKNSSGPPNSTGSKPLGGSREAQGSNFSSKSPFLQHQKHPKRALDRSLVPTEPGFRPRQYEQRTLPSYLQAPARSIREIHVQPDSWDLANQQRMLDVEKSTSDMQAMYEKLQEMRENERKEMENRGLVDRENTRKRLDQAITFVGSCHDMCPPFERIRRTYENNVKQLEKDPVTGKVTGEYAIKAFSRPAAGQPPPLPSDVRPPHVLQRTLYYLVDNVLPKLPASHSFLWDRTRSIRQDFTYQNYSGVEAIECNELIVRIHILSLHIMASSEQEYSQQQELEQMNKALQTLSEFYVECRKRGIPDPSDRESEMRAYQLLSHLRDTDVEQQVQQHLPTEKWSSPIIRYALRFRALAQQNLIMERGYSITESAPNLFVDFFNTIHADQNVPILLLCLLESQFNSIRINGLKAMSKSYHARGKPFAIPRLTRMLGFNDDSETTSFCESYEIVTITDDNGVSCVDLTSLTDEMIANAKPRQQAYSSIVGSRIRQSGSYGAIIYDGNPRGSTGEPRSTTKFLNSQFAKPQPASSAFTVPQSSAFSGQQSTGFGQAEKRATGLNTNVSTAKIPAVSAVPPPSAFLLKPAVNSALTSSIPGGFSVDRSSTLFKPGPVKPVDQTSPNQQETVTPSLESTGGHLKPTAPIESLYGIAEKTLQQPVVQFKRPATPPPPIQKLPPYREWEVQQAKDVIVKQVVDDALSSAIRGGWERILRRRSQRADKINLVTSDIYSDLIGQVYRRAVAETYGDQWYSQKLKAKAIRSIKESMLQVVEKQRERDMRRQEYNLVTQELGRSSPVVFDMMRRRKRQSGGSGASTKRRAPMSDENQYSLVEQARAHLADVWGPLDLTSVLLTLLDRTLYENGKQSRNVTVGVYCNDWESTTIGAWIQAKLGLGLSIDSRTVENDRHTSLTVMKLYDDPTSFTELGLIVYVISGEITEQECVEQIGFLINAVTSASKYKVDLMLVAWGLGDDQVVQVGTKVYSQTGNPDLNRVIVCTMADPPTKDNLAGALEQWVSKFRAEASGYGKAKDFRIQQEQRAEIARQKRLQEQSRQQQKETAHRTALEKISSLRVLHRFTKPQNSSPSSQPQPQREPQPPSTLWDGRNDSTSSPNLEMDETSTEPIPKSILELRQLVNSVRQELTVGRSGHVGEALQ